MRWFFRYVDIKVYHKKWHGNTFFSHVRVAGRDVLGHMARSLQVKMVRFVWANEKMEYFKKMYYSA